ncbi:MAG: hypothetical protein IKH38_02410 [Clostridia bacterium]|nr:hypothetical protein [Clostridia bacterium]
MKRSAICLVLLLLLGLFLCAGGAAESGKKIFQYRFAGAAEGAEILLANRDYYENMTQNDLNYRMQKTGATLAELEAFIPGQVLDFTDAEIAAIDAAMAEMEAVCTGRGYRLPATDSIVFIKTTMAEECGAGAYTHGTEIYLGESVLSYASREDSDAVRFFKQVLAHELFHCLTRKHPDFRAAMYGILGFTVVEKDFAFPPEIRNLIISNPDVEHHNSYAAFEIKGEMKNCTVIFTTEPFRKPGDMFFDHMVTGLVPIDDLGTLYTKEDAANFWDVFGRNTNYVIDPEETLADNFRMTIFDGPGSMEFQSPEIIEAIDRLLKDWKPEQ